MVVFHECKFKLQLTELRRDKICLLYYFTLLYIIILILVPLDYRKHVPKAFQNKKRLLFPRNAQASFIKSVL